MKVVILGPAHPYRGGIAAFSERLAAEYQAEGNDVKIVTFTLQYPSFLFPGKTQMSTTEPPASLDISRMLSSVNPITWCRTGRAIAKMKPDLLVVQYWMPFMAPAMGVVARIVRRSGTKVVSVVHNMLPHERHFFDKPLAKYFVRSIDGVVAMSHLTVDELHELDNTKRHVLSPHPIYDHYGAIVPRDEAITHLQLDPSSRYLLFFGFVRGYKGLDLLLQAMADKRLTDRNLKLIVAGEFYDDPQPYLDQIQNLGLADRVALFNDYIADNEVSNYFCAADAVVLPYRSATQSGITQIAMHFAKPMIVTNVGGLPDIVKHEVTGLVTQPDADSIASTIANYYDRDLQQTLAAGVANEKDLYTWDKMVRAIETL
ncbi:MAG: glycosyltransferase [Bacteroidales bacterium]|nr:glycosyltransferase [Bacteroidales bacterium]